MLSKLFPNQLYIGIIYGIIGPVIGFILYYIINFSHITLINFINKIISIPSIQSPLLSLCLIMNLAIFFIFFQYKYDKAARGVILATLIYAPIVIILKFY